MHMDCMTQAAPSAKSVFPEVAQNSLRIPFPENSMCFPCSEKSPSIPDFQVCGHPVTVSCPWTRGHQLNLDHATTSGNFVTRKCATITKQFIRYWPKGGALTLSAGSQEVHPAHKNTSFSHLQRFWDTWMKIAICDDWPTGRQLLKTRGGDQNVVALLWL